MTPHPSSSLGASFDPLHVQVEMPYDFYAQVRQEDPIPFSPALDAYLVSRYDDVRAILSQPEIFSSKDVFDFRMEIHPQAIAELMKGYPYIPHATIGCDGAKHRKLKGTLQKALSPQRVRSMEPCIREVVTRLIDTFLDKKEAEIISQFAYPLPLEVIFTLLGIPEEDRNRVKKETDFIQMLIDLPLSKDEQVECARHVVALQHYYANLIEERRKHPGEDIISDLIRYGFAEDDPRQDAALIDQIAGLIFAGHETTAQLIGSGMVLLLKGPRRWQSLCEHSEYIPQAIEEILRLQGPAQGFIRTTTQEVTIGGRSLPAGTRLLVLYASGNRDECQFANADHFEMQRQPNHHLAFGYGVHFCAGAALGRLEGRIAFEELTKRIPQIKLAPDQQFEQTFNLRTYGYNRVYVQWE